MTDLVLNDAVAKEELIGKVTENTLQQLFVSTEAMAEFTNPVKAEIRAIFSDIDPKADDVVDQFSARVSGFFARYPAIYETIDAESFESTLKGAMLSSLLNGYR